MLVQSFLDKKAAEYTESRRRRQNTGKPLSRVPVNDVIRLSGQHYPVRSEYRRKGCNSAYQVNAASGKRIDKKTNDYCPKCQKHIYANHA